jgi:hypothetical protein
MAETYTNLIYFTLESRMDCLQICLDKWESRSAYKITQIGQ